MLKQGGAVRGHEGAAPAAFRRLCVETPKIARLACLSTPAAFRRLCVETVNCCIVRRVELTSRLQAAVC